MDCKKNPATWAKCIAQRMLKEKDYAGAKDFALKAQALYPGLDGLTEMFATLEACMSSGETKVNGEDSVLSDKPKRQAYNQRKSGKGLQQKVPTDTCWRICNCSKIYLDHTLRCPTCDENFPASKTSAPNYNSSSSQTQAGAAQPQRSVLSRRRWLFSTIIKAENMLQQARESLKREREELLLHFEDGWEKPLKKRRGLGDDFNGSGVETASHQVGTGHVGAGAGNIFGKKKRRKSALKVTHRSRKEMEFLPAPMEEPD